MKRIILFSLLIILIACSSDSDTPTVTPPTEAMYFPPMTGNIWETKSMAELQWDETQVQPLLNFLEEKNTKSFIVLVNGKIVMEHYLNGHSAITGWYWASAGKTLTATVTGIAEQDGFLDINDKVSDYLGAGWTSMPAVKENLITNKHLLTMTSGIDDSDPIECVTPDCLSYTADAGTRWAYHNVYVKLQDVIAQATGQSFSSYFNTKLRDKIGMSGGWFTSGENQVYFSNSRSMARFGLLALNKGKWDSQQILNESYFNSATNTSQNINLAYGYLWWLNGKESFHLPGTQIEFPGTLIPSAPSDMYMALGKNDQKIYVVPSMKLVVIRMGDAADDENFALSGFDEELWEKLNLLMN